MIVRGERRSGAAAVEMAAIAPVLVFFLFGMIVVGLGVFRYNQTAYLAREAARYASVRGDDYTRETDGRPPAATQQTVIDNVIKARATGLDPGRLTTTVVWDGKDKTGKEIKTARLVSPTTGAVTTNYVTVTVSYQWRPEVPFVPPLTLTSTSRVPVSQ